MLKNTAWKDKVPKIQAHQQASTHTPTVATNRRTMPIDHPCPHQQIGCQWISSANCLLWSLSYFKLPTNSRKTWFVKRELFRKDTFAKLFWQNVHDWAPGNSKKTTLWDHHANKRQRHGGQTLPCMQLWSREQSRPKRKHFTEAGKREPHKQNRLKASGNQIRAASNNLKKRRRKKEKYCNLKLFA